jgi:hypothetical protein
MARGNSSVPGTPRRVFRSATGKIERLVSAQYAVGMFDFASWQSSPLQLGEGDVLVVYSDGVSDAGNHRDEMFGEQRLLELIRRDAPGGCEVLERGILTAIDEFTHATPQTDDITFVLVENAPAQSVPSVPDRALPDVNGRDKSACAGSSDLCRPAPDRGCKEGVMCPLVPSLAMDGQIRSYQLTQGQFFC